MKHQTIGEELRQRAIWRIRMDAAMWIFVTVGFALGIIWGVLRQTGVIH